MAIREFNQYHFSGWFQQLIQGYCLKGTNCLLSLPATLPQLICWGIEILQSR